MWPLAVLTGDSIYVFFNKEMYGRFARRSKKSGRNNEVTVLPRWPRKAGFHCSGKRYLRHMTSQVSLSDLDQ